MEFNISFKNPLYKYFTKSQTIKHYFLKNKQLSKNKTMEIQISKFDEAYTAFSFHFGLSFSGKDHAGLCIEFDIFQYFFCFQITDNRHWDYENDQWVKYDQN